MRMLALAAVVAALASCERQPDHSADIASLRAQVADLSSQVAALRQQQVSATAVQPASPAAELEIADGAQHFSRPYATVEGCQSAMRQALAENDRRKAEMDSENARTQGFQQLGFVHVNAFCIRR